MRQVLRKTGVFLSGLIVMGVVAVGSAQAVVLTFEDVPGGSIQNQYGNMPTYKGFTFSFTLDWIDVENGPVSNTSWPYGAHSGDFAILNNNSGVGTITEATGADFTFDGLWAKRWGTSPNSGGANSLSGTLSGFNNGSQVWSVGTGLNGSYQLFGAQAGAIDELRLGLGNNFLVDDISLNAGSSNPPQVPEPSTMLLFGSGLAALAAWRKKRTRTL